MCVSERSASNSFVYVFCDGGTFNSMAVCFLADTDLTAKVLFLSSTNNSVDNPPFFLFDSISSKNKGFKIATRDHSKYAAKPK